MAIAIASALGVDVGGEPLFRDVSFTLNAGDRMTLAGRNGAGKSTLLRTLAGEHDIEDGQVILAKGARVALHDQRPPRDAGLTLAEYVYSGRTDMLEYEAELARLEKLMADGDHSSATMSAYAETQAKLEAAGGYLWRDGVLDVLKGLRFDESQIDRQLDTFSGGELTRASLARALAARPDLLLLDEPTNHLDIPTLEWLENYLVELDSAVVLVAHDRWFLEAVGTSVLELEAGKSRFFSGPWHAWRKEKAAREIAIGRQIERQQAEIARMERFVERFRYKATKARQAQSRLKKIERIKENAASFDPRDTRTLRFSFPEPERPGRVVLNMVKAKIEVPGRTLLESADFTVERGEHVVLVGPNGAGKTTLVATLAGERKPASGSVRVGHNVKIGYLSQHAETASGDGTVLDAVVRATGLTGQKARTLLGGFLFSGKDVEKQLSDISGGEQRRLSLAILVASGANVLILDEPTNHLDVESREALEDALLEYKGTIILISHDRALLEAVGTRTVVCADGRLESHLGGWTEYRKKLDEIEERKAAEAAAAAAAKKQPSEAQLRRMSVKERQKAERRVNALEEKIHKAEAALAELEDELSDPSAWASPSATERNAARHEEAKRLVDELYEQYEEATELLARAG